ncbi:hypothetical protein [uncultured Lutibacter sp.]|uniref:hypothetical protein n=1 Tax=uncultured Lutibacter sp. TaxID=437739 RepID=UPI00260D7450|nr:hypothetical protein [uncultured Lutibacter sp.]
MKNIFSFIVLIFLVLSCSNSSVLHKEFACNNSKIDNPKVITDFNKNFKLTISNNWKTTLYFSEFESEIFAADTLKQLTETFILGTSFNFGVLNIDANFYKKTDSILTHNNLEIINSGKHSFQSKPASWYVAKGIKNGFTYHKFNLTAKLSENSYFNGYSEIYGDNNINERICETISILEKIEFLQ